MGKLFERLNDASRSGVYRAPRPDAILEAARGSALRVSRIGLAGAAGKEKLMARFSAALAFPDWFGANWDALEDCLADLSWLGAEGNVLLLEGADGLPADERGILEDVLAAAASSWSARRKPFFAVFIGGANALPELYRERK